MRILSLAFLALALLARPAVAAPEAARANDNRVAAGTLEAGVLHVALEARMAVWHPDGDDGPGIPIQALAEAGRPAQIPGPLIRVPVGTLVVASVRNQISETTLVVHGMVDRPSNVDGPVTVPFGAARTIRFRASAEGTFLYWASTSGKVLGRRFGADSQLNGAFVVDPRSSTKPNDRVFLISQWINVLSKKGNPIFRYELDSINGRSWPHTEHLSYAKDSTVHWRVVNASPSSHPLHLHGFYFQVDSRGDGLADNVYARDVDRQSKVTELIEPGSTFAMTWHTDRPGNWLFHCHLAYHIIGHLPTEILVAGKNTITDDEFESTLTRHAGMGGLILAVTVHGSRTQVARTAPVPEKHIQLRVMTAADDRPDAPSFRYVVGSDATPSQAAVGPPIVLTRGVPYSIDVTNMLTEPTAVHWHGMELADSYYDGVAGFSGNATRAAPMIMPGDTFAARFTPTRSGTFIYHTHMDDIWQLRGGLAGPLIVLEPGATWDPSTDHVFTVTTTHTIADALNIFVNGTSSPAPVVCHVGVPQRFRVINMTTFWTNALVSLNAANGPVRWTRLQVDGADVPTGHRSLEPAIETLTIGETQDYTYVPKQPGQMQLQFYPDISVPHIVTVPVTVVN